ncbi:MAG: NAD(P)/FAD-dependent oxidoreductase [Candidatus Methanoplasma sp.]|jgi:geranylgeranyl reductase family protein|nr:NAD(P)/FAD-dependent oxidoreductase [Candidatus Methanoplasma sp.]
MRDAVVVGGGPAGTITAGLLSDGRDVLVIEEHASSGLPVQCAGILTEEAIRMCGVKPDILGKITGADVIFPSGGRFEVRSDCIKALLIDRADLDRKLAERAIDRGAEIKYGTRYVSHKVSGTEVSVSTDSGDISSKLIVGADGHSSRIAMSVGRNLPREYVYGMGADVRYRSGRDNIMTLRIGSEYAPGFFSWEIPFGDMMRVGLCIKAGTGSNPNEYLKKLLRVSGIKDCDIISRYSGKIPLGGRRRSYGDRTLLIGDAAGQVKPISGGGLYPICMAAPILRDTAEESLLTDRTSSRFLSRYEEGWKRKIGRELSRGYRIRKIYTGLSDRDLDRVSEIISDDEIRPMLNGIDLDNPSAVAAPIVRSPRVCMRLLPLMIRAIL